jgi:multidrug efflux pump subunit AcrA (membrane-fusion protein)
MSGSATVEITIPNRDTKLIPGMAANAKLTLEQKNDVIALPNAALFTNGSSKVLVVQDGVAHMKEIKLGLVGNDYTEVLSGLTGGEKAVTIGKERVSDGDKVNMIEESAE